jgi:hypothetical protein
VTSLQRNSRWISTRAREDELSPNRYRPGLTPNSDGSREGDVEDQGIWSAYDQSTEHVKRGSNRRYFMLFPIHDRTNHNTGCLDIAIGVRRGPASEEQFLLTGRRSQHPLSILLSNTLITIVVVGLNAWWRLNGSRSEKWQPAEQARPRQLRGAGHYSRPRTRSWPHGDAWHTRSPRSGFRVPVQHARVEPLGPSNRVRLHGALNVTNFISLHLAKNPSLLGWEMQRPSSEDGSVC